MRVGVLYEEDPEEAFSPAEFLAHYPCAWEMILLKRPVREKVIEVAKENSFDVYFNLCDAPVSEAYAGIDVVHVLEELNLPFTGSGRGFYDPTREEMQAAAETIGIGFARGYRISRIEELDVSPIPCGSLDGKAPQSFGSTGMTRIRKVEPPSSA
jgi:hypothetical protein